MPDFNGEKPFVGIFPIPEATKWAERQIAMRKGITALLVFSLLITSSVVFFVMQRLDVETNFIVVTILFDALIMFFVIYFFRRTNLSIKNVLPKVRGRELIFQDSYLEIAGSILSFPSPSQVIAMPHPYLRVDYENIESVKIDLPVGAIPNIALRLDMPGASSMGTPYIFLNLRNRKVVSFLKILFRGRENDLAAAFKSHGIDVKNT